MFQSVSGHNSEQSIAQYSFILYRKQIRHVQYTRSVTVRNFDLRSVQDPYVIFLLSNTTAVNWKQAFNVHHIKRLWHTNQEFIILRSPNLWQFEFWIIVITLNHQSKGLAATDIASVLRKVHINFILPCLDSPAHCKNVVGRSCDTAENPWKYNYSPAATNQRKAGTVSKKRIMIVVLDFFVANEKWLSVSRWTELPNEFACFRICNIFVNCLWIFAQRWLPDRSLRD